jgi:uncharacterized protein
VVRQIGSGSGLFQLVGRLGKRRRALTAGARRAFTAGLLAGSLLAGTAAARAPPDHGLVWELRGERNTIYLAGSMHLLRPDAAELPAPVHRAYRDSSELVMEIDLDDLDPQAGALFTAARGTYSPGESLRAALGEARWARVLEVGTKLGLPAAALDRLEPWVVALLLSVAQMSAAGLDINSGVEQQLQALAQTDGKPIEGLETMDFQLSIFDNLAPEQQAKFLDLTLAEGEQMSGQLDAVSAAWREGRAKDLESLLLGEYAKFPELYEALVYQRNRDWIPKIRALAGRDGNVLVVVGALHLVGAQGVVAMLEQAGYKPRRMTALPPAP